MKLCEIFSLTRYDQKMYIYVTNAYDQNVCLGRGTRYDIICDVENVDNILPHMLDEVNGFGHTGWRYADSRPRCNV